MSLSNAAPAPTDAHPPLCTHTPQPKLTADEFDAEVSKAALETAKIAEHVERKEVRYLPRDLLPFPSPSTPEKAAVRMTTACRSSCRWSR